MYLIEFVSSVLTVDETTCCKITAAFKLDFVKNVSCAVYCSAVSAVQLLTITCS